MRWPRRRCPRPRRSRRRIPPPVCSIGAACWVDAGENSAYPLFSQKKITGSCHTAARFTASWNAPWATAPSPKNATRHAVVGSELGRGRGSHRDGKTGGNDPVRAEDPDVRVGDVHRAAATAVGALVLGHQLGEHAERVEALGQAVAVPAVRRRDDVVGTERPARADRGGLLPDREVHEAGDLAVAVEHRPRAARTRGSAASGDASPGALRPRTQEGTIGRESRRMYCTGRYNQGKCDDRSDRDPRVVPWPRRGHGEAGGDHRREPRARRVARARVLARRRLRRPRRPHREGSEGGGRGPSRTLPGAQR